MSKNIKYKVISAISLILFLGFWEITTDVMHIMPSYALPSPIKVIQSFFIKLYSTSPDGSTLIVHVMTSLKVAVLGFMSGAIVGTPLGIMMAWHKKVDRVVRPVFDLLRTIPPIGWIPIMILILGIGTEAKVAVIFLSAFVPCVINAYTGIIQTSKIHLWVGQTFGATNHQLLKMIAIPTALPFIFTGLRVSLSIAWMSLVAAELLAATKGLGYMIQIARTIGRVDLIVVGMITIGIVGNLLSAILEFFENKYVKGEELE
jgi:NitT/TauT family transport system permease protein/taurine transport system permease protein